MKKTKKDYRHHRLGDPNELYPYLVEMGQKAYHDYFDRVYNKVQGMLPGHSFLIDNMVVETNRDVFIKMLCLIIQLDERIGEFYFNESFTVFYRRVQRTEFKRYVAYRNRNKQPQ